MPGSLSLQNAKIDCIRRGSPIAVAHAMCSWPPKCYTSGWQRWLPREIVSTIACATCWLKTHSCVCSLDLTWLAMGKYCWVWGKPQFQAVSTDSVAAAGEQEAHASNILADEPAMLYQHEDE